MKVVDIPYLPHCVQILVPEWPIQREQQGCTSWNGCYLLEWYENTDFQVKAGQRHKLGATLGIYSRAPAWVRVTSSKTPVYQMNSPITICSYLHIDIALHLHKKPTFNLFCMLLKTKFNMFYYWTLKQFKWNTSSYLFCL